MSMVSRDAIGQTHAPKRDESYLTPGQRRVFILTCAQNNTFVHVPTWESLNTLAAHEDATLLVASFTYNKSSHTTRGQKRKTSKERSEVMEWWDSRVEPFLADHSIQLAPGLVWCGELQILPTAVTPLSGMESYTARDSSIIPHVKVALQSVASPKHQGTKLMYTTGTATLRNYINKKAGQKAAFHHSYGGLIVEVTAEGTWFVRQLCADSEGVIYDLDRRIDGEGVTTGHRPEAIVWGDIHDRQMEKNMLALGWGSDGILETLQPKRQVLHDLLDFRSQNHHDLKDPWRMFKKVVDGKTSVAGEVYAAGQTLGHMSRFPWCHTVVVSSNHDKALERWLKEVDFRTDLGNAEFYLEAQLATFKAIRQGDNDFYAVEWALRRALPGMKGRFLRQDEEYVVCHDANGGIELGMHGDKGANGAKGSLAAFARTGRKCIVADSHTAGIRDGAYQVGVMGALDQGYNEGQSSWSHTNALVYPNGKRALFTIWKGAWRG